MFRINSAFYADGYKTAHKRMLAPGTTRLYGTWIPRSLKHAPKGIEKIVSFGQQIVVRWLHDEWTENFFKLSEEEAMKFSKDMSLYLGQEYDGEHFRALHTLGYLPIKIKSLPEGIETSPNVPHMTFINTVDGFAWLTLYLETIISSLAWKPATSATIALQYKRNLVKWVMKTDPSNMWLIDYLCHDFSARGLSPWDMISSGLGHATSHKGSDTLPVIPAARYFYGERENQVVINSVNASEHSVSTTKIFTVGEKQMIIDWLKEFPTGILSIVADTFDLWKLITEYLTDLEVKELIMARDGKLVIRPDSGDPVEIICGVKSTKSDLDDNIYRLSDTWETYPPDEDITITKHKNDAKPVTESEQKGVIELLWDIFGGTVNEQGYKVLDPHIGTIYGDSINLERQTQIYERLEAKGFASTNIVLGIGSYTYQYNTRDTFGFAAKGAWFEVKETDYSNENNPLVGITQDVTQYEIYKDPITDDGTKTSLRGLIAIRKTDLGGYQVFTECSEETEKQGELKIIYENGKFFNQVTLTEIREKINQLANK